MTVETRMPESSEHAPTEHEQAESGPSPNSTTSTSPINLTSPINQQGSASRALLIFTVSAALLGLLDSRRLGGYLERLELPGATDSAELVRQVASLSGAELISNAESRLLRDLTPHRRLGVVMTPAHAVTLDPAPLSPFDPNPELPSAVPDLTPSATLPEHSQAGIAPAPHESPLLVELPVAHAPAPIIQTEKPRVLIVGDSLIMEGLGPALLRTLRKNTDLDVAREGKYSTGLTRTDTFDWPKHMETLVPDKRPNLIVVCLGANDFQDILIGGKRHIAGTEKWSALYRARADAFLAAATRDGAEVLWLGLPIMGSESYEKRIRALSNLQQAACASVAPLCRFADNVSVLADKNGNYLSHITDDQGRQVRLRYKDKIHVTEPAGQMITDAVLPLLNDLLKPRMDAYKQHEAEQAAKQAEVDLLAKHIEDDSPTPE